MPSNDIKCIDTSTLAHTHTHERTLKLCTQLCCGFSFCCIWMHLVRLFYLIACVVNLELSGAWSRLGIVTSLEAAKNQAKHPQPTGQDLRCVICVTCLSALACHFLPGIHRTLLSAKAFGEKQIVFNFQMYELMSRLKPQQLEC